ncbi:MAG: cytochrome c3 family protein [Eggerthellaceae bacterium]|jgi:flagellar basal body-associated protein FliL|nr:cytochrome c3 family protein [Eggerthellaceae bacterium]
MSEENAKEQSAAETVEQASAEPAAKKPKKKWPIVLGVVVVVLVVAGIGMWVWHSQPSFCNAMCHTPMDTYVQTYDATPGSEATDKWGNEVSDASAMLAATHKQAGLTCLSCHTPAISQQITEVGETVTGDYYYPLEERSLDDLMTNSGSSESGDSFCLKSGCHDGINSRTDLTNATSNMDFNPHRWQHGQIACSECHKSHRASVFYCTQCHSEASDSMPSGWVTYSEGKQIAASAQ